MNRRRSYHAHCAPVRLCTNRRPCPSKRHIVFTSLRSDCRSRNHRQPLRRTSIRSRCPHRRLELRCRGPDPARPYRGDPSHTWWMARPWNGTSKYRQGYTGRDFHVTGGHESEAKAAQEAKKPNRFGLWIVRKLGYRAPDPTPPHQSPPHQSPPHQSPPHPRTHPAE